VAEFIGKKATWGMVFHQLCTVRRPTKLKKAISKRHLPKKVGRHLGTFLLNIVFRNGWNPKAKFSRCSSYCNTTWTIKIRSTTQHGHIISWGAHLLNTASQGMILNSWRIFTRERLGIRSGHTCKDTVFTDILSLTISLIIHPLKQWKWLF